MKPSQANHGLPNSAKIFYHHEVSTVQHLHTGMLYRSYHCAVMSFVTHRLAADDEAFKKQRIANTEHYKQALAEQVP